MEENNKIEIGSNPSPSERGRGEVLARFSNRVDNYIKFRPDYPVEVIAFLQKQGILQKDSVIADIGSGTGISAELFLKEGNVVYGVEPNKEMREAAERLLVGYKNFRSINATAENTLLENNSIDLIVAGQAFHWFDKEKCKEEFKRILRESVPSGKPQGIVVLMWNDRRTESTQFLQAYEDFIKMFATDYLQVNHKNIDEKIFNSFFSNSYKMESFLNYQYFDFEGLKGRILSSSYMPAEGHKDFDFMMGVLKKIFNRFAEEGKVTIEYDTKLYFGKLN